MIKKTLKPLATLADVEREVVAQYRELGRRQLALEVARRNHDWHEVWQAN